MIVNTIVKYKSLFPKPIYEILRKANHKRLSFQSLLTNSFNRSRFLFEFKTFNLNKAKKLKIKYDYAKSIFTNNNMPTDFSIIFGVAPCNHSCLFCPQSVKKPKKATWLDLNVLAKVLNEMPEENVKLHVSSYSEALVTPNLVEYIKTIKKIRPKLPVAFASNGTIFREDVISDLFRNKLDIYQYSFDAPNRDIYKRMMQSDDFDKVWNHLEKIVELRNKINPSTKIITHILGFEESKKDFVSFKKYWEKKVDLVYWREFKNWGGQWGLEDNLKKAGFEYSDKIPKKRYPCTSIFMHFKLNPLGFYSPCVTSVPDYKLEEEVHKAPYLGDARKMTFNEAWEKLNQIRLDHLKGNWNKYDMCKKCSVWSAWKNPWIKEGNVYKIPKIKNSLLKS